VTLRAAFVGACPYPVPQGSQVYLAESARALQRRGHDVRLITYGHGEGPAPDDLRVVRTPRVPGDAITRSGPNFAKLLLDPLLVRTIRREPVDVLFAHNYEALLACLLARTAPVVYQAHNAMADQLPYYLGEWIRPFGLWLDRALPKRAAAVIAERLEAHEAPALEDGLHREIRQLLTRSSSLADDALPSITESE